MKKRIILLWLPFAVTGTVLCGLIYGAVQQNYRQSANDPQIQLAEDGATALSQGADPAELLGQGTIDIGTSLANFAIIYGSDGTPLVSTGVLDGETPDIPAGVLAYALTHSQDRLTWQPAPGVRIAAVVQSYTAASSTGYILVGRSLTEVESREALLELMCAAAWVILMAGTLIAVAYAEVVSKRGGRLS